MDPKRAIGGIVGTCGGLAMWIIQTTHPEWLGNHPWVLPASLVLFFCALVLWLCQYRWTQRLLGIAGFPNTSQEGGGSPWKTKEHWRQKYEEVTGEKNRLEQTHAEEIRKLEASHKAELWRAQESYRQCSEELRESAARNLEYRGQLAMFGPLQFDALQLSTTLLNFLKRLGPEPPPKYSRDQIAKLSATETKRLIETKDGDFSEACAYHDGDQRIFDISADSLYRGMQNRHVRMLPWYEKLRASYALELKSKVEEIRNRFSIEGLSDGVLILPVQDFNGLKNVQLIAAKLWELAFTLEERKQQ
jgi:hypothetical protein